MTWRETTFLNNQNCSITIGNPTAIPRVLQAHGMEAGDGIAGTCGCRRKRKCPGESSVRSPGHYCVGIHAGIGRCQGLVGTGTDALPWVTATEKEGRFALVQDFVVGLRCCFIGTVGTRHAGRSCPFGRSRPVAGVPPVLPPRFIAPGCLPCCGAIRLEGDAVCFGAGDLVAAGEVDGVEDAIRSEREDGVDGFERCHDGSPAMCRAWEAPKKVGRLRIRAGDGISWGGSARKYPRALFNEGPTAGAQR